MDSTVINWLEQQIAQAIEAYGKRNFAFDANEPTQHPQAQVNIVRPRGGEHAIRVYVGDTSMLETVVIYLQVAGHNIRRTSSYSIRFTPRLQEGL